MKKRDENFTTYNLINSVKGGCGKTTFSIWLSIYLNNTINDNDNKTLLIDMDLLGTSMLIVFYGKIIEMKTAFTNDIFKEVHKMPKKFVNAIELKNGTKINVIFSNMDYKEREKFKAGRFAGYTPAVKYSIFRTGLQELIKMHETIDGGSEVKHFVFDMPPNSDGFSDAAMECIFEKKYRVVKKDDRKNLFMLIGSEWGQTYATIAEIQSMLQHTELSMPDRLFFVFNHNLVGEFPPKGYNDRKNELEKAIKNLKLTDKEKKSIYFLVMECNSKYTEMLIGNENEGNGNEGDGKEIENGTGGIGLTNAGATIIGNAIPKAVISHYARFGEPFIEIAQDKGAEILRKLIEGDEDVS